MKPKVRQLQNSQRSLSVEDRFEITQVLAQYGHVMDRRDYEGLAEVFAKDAIFDVSSVGGPVYRGLTELRESTLR